MDDDIARAAHAKKGSPFLSTEQAAFYLGLSARKLQQMRAGRDRSGVPQAQPLCALSYQRSRRLVEGLGRDGEAWCLTAAPPPAVPHCGDELRRIISARQLRRRGVAIAALAACAAAPLAASAIWKAPVLFVWNASASAPVGLYRVHPG